MINITEEAIKRIKEIFIKRKYILKEYYLQISIKSGGCVGLEYKFDIYKLDQLKGEYSIINIANINILCNGDEKFFTVGKLDFIKEFGGGYLRFSNSNATRNCGCGKSFAM